MSKGFRPLWPGRSLALPRFCHTGLVVSERSVKIRAMAQCCEKVVVAMSGGVDSSVAACLLVEQGYDVIGFFMRVGGAAAEERPEAVACAASAAGAAPADSIGLDARNGSASNQHNGTSSRHQGCCSAADAADARFVAGMLGIPFYALNFERDFDEIIDYFAAEYAGGRTPNPCVVCNDRLKFGKMVEYADAVGARYVATGHYARIHRSGCGAPDGRPRLLRAVDNRKDQSYVLFGLQREVLARTLFPIGHLSKSQVRQIAQKFGLPNQNKPDSVEICFVPDRNYARVVRARRPDGFVRGEVVDQDGRVIGHHDGLGHYTVGQRRGLGIAAGRPIYVTRLDVLNNRVVMGDSQALTSPGLIAERASFLVDGLGATFRAQIKIRYLHSAVDATVRRLEGDRIAVMFDEPQRAVTPGQAAVFYDREVVLGGAWIASAMDGIP